MTGAKGKPMPEERQRALLEACSFVLPTPVLTQLLGISNAAFYRLRKRCEIKLTQTESKKVNRDFLESLPDLGQLPLTEPERQLVRLVRLEWLERRKGEAHDRQLEIVRQCSPLLPTRAIAAILEVSPGTVIKRQKELGLEITRSERRTLEHDFASSRQCPELDFLVSLEQFRLEAAWKEAHQKHGAVTGKRAERSEAYGEKLLEKLREMRAALQAAGGGFSEVQCSGACGEAWPRKKDFFASNWRSKDGLSQRCKYCVYQEGLRRKREGAKRRKPRSHVPRGPERLRLLMIVCLYGEIIPAEILRGLFKISRETLSRLWREAGITMSASKSRRILWAWFFRHSMPEFEELNLHELARMQILSIELRHSLEARFERDKEHVRFLRAEAAQYRADHYGEDFVQQQCRHCPETYPVTRDFFRVHGDSLEPVCKACANYFRAQQRLARLKRRFSRG